MEARTINVNGRDYTFICNYRKNRSGFVHECELHIGVQLFESKCQYYNRTWESYTYQTVMYGALRNYEEYITKILKENFLDETGHKRMTASLKVDFDVLCSNNQELKDIAYVRKELEHRN